MMEFNIEKISLPESKRPTDKNYRRFMFLKMQDIIDIYDRFKLQTSIEPIDYVIINGCKIKMTSERMEKMVKALRSNKFEEVCPLYFSMERGENDKTAKINHLNLYGFDCDEKIVMITKSDIAENGYQLTYLVYTNSIERRLK